MIDRRHIRYFDWISFVLMLILTGIGLLFVFSATSKDHAMLSPFFKKQLFGAISGLIVYFVFSFVDLQGLCRWGFFGFFGVLFLLVYTIIGGWIGMGAKRWISLYFITFQPSELVKLMLPLSFAFYFSEQKTRPHPTLPLPISDFVFPLALLFISFLLILKQPDLGTALIILFSGIIILWLARIPKLFFLCMILFSTLGAPLLWRKLKPYQQQRILVLLGHGDNKKERYQVEQSKIAIGSGGLTGRGLMKGTQNRLSFLPEARTDFIFSVLCEEWGFLGALFVLLLFSLLFLRLISIILQAPTLLEQLLGMGLLAPIMLSTITNIGMVAGLLPIVGIPLPLFTYGISHMWVTFANLGILNNIAIRRFLKY